MLIAYLILSIVSFLLTCMSPASLCEYATTCLATSYAHNTITFSQQLHISSIGALTLLSGTTGPLVLCLSEGTWAREHIINIATEINMSL